MFAVLPGGFGEETLHLQVSLALMLIHAPPHHQWLPCTTSSHPETKRFWSCTCTRAPDSIDSGLSSGNLKWWLPLLENGLTSLSNNMTGWHIIMQRLMSWLGVHWELSPVTVLFGCFLLSFLFFFFNWNFQTVPENSEFKAKHRTCHRFVLTSTRKRNCFSFLTKEVEKVNL